MGDSDDPPPAAALPSSPPPPSSPPTTATASGSQEPTRSPTVSKDTKKSGENSPKDQPKPNEKQGADKDSKESKEKKSWADSDDDSDDEPEDAAAALKQFLITDFPRFGDKSVFTEAYESAAETLYSTVVWGKNNWVNIGSRCAHFGVLQRMFAGASNMNPAMFAAWMKERGIELPRNDNKDPSRHYNAWLRKNHPTRAPTLADLDTAKAAVSQTQPPPKPSKGKEREVPETAPATAPATTSSTADQSTTNRPAVRNTNDAQQGVAVKRPNLQEVRNSLSIRKQRWAESNLPDSLREPDEGPFEVRLPLEAPEECLFTGRMLRECQFHINQCLRIGRERRGKNWYLVIYEAPKDDPTSGIRLPHFVGHVIAYSEGYFALRAYKTALHHGIRREVGDYFKMYFEHQKNSIRDALMALDLNVLKACQEKVAGEAARQEVIERITNDVFQVCQTTKDEPNSRLKRVMDIYNNLDTVKGYDTGLFKDTSEIKKAIGQELHKFAGDSSKQITADVASKFIYGGTQSTGNAPTDAATEQFQTTGLIGPQRIPAQAGPSIAPPTAQQPPLTSASSLSSQFSQLKVDEPFNFTHPTPRRRGLMSSVHASEEGENPYNWGPIPSNQPAFTWD
ncbi:hypothetical protein K4K49_012908 [Colletotrichum sp. SAR 10_70]|nr:hypothetical protein K4K50_006845 [Colletotrichum sp. SAR 10_71]KAI8166781.1 hypothetical protein KHU50_006666 [Colletotrichum sp. SAR 10_65]KAI8187729.1 hypothetical protein K4K51_008099 [Colletotrichum sp. SAR 10_75]KAI8188050.1 hypothetical protein K4K49_012908 [Colletotrichum sp. SAR 10_70]KAI8248061.1 hypothetical protein K4K53_001139 [Colletotrichum sp. SAR 10_77]KAJ4996831.1 hypothetical protein K4K48_007788 [Colletotrichum sp. SAR 10_66]